MNLPPDSVVAFLKPRRICLTLKSDEPLHLEPLKKVMYRAAAAELVSQSLSQTEEPWPRGYEMLAKLDGKSPLDEEPRATESEIAALWKAHAKRTDFARRVLQAWQNTQSLSTTGREMDALLMPCTPGPACPP